MSRSSRFASRMRSLIDWMSIGYILRSAVLFIAMATIAVCTVQNLSVWLVETRTCRSAVNTSCRAFMTEGHIEGSKWQPRNCRMHYYDKPEIAQCMIRSERARKRRKLFVFIGDSRMREQHQTFIDLAARKPYYNLTAFRCYQSSANFADDLFDVEFVWNAHLQPFPRLQQWLKNPPAFVAVSVGLWHLLGNRYNLQNGLNQFKGALKAMLDTFNQLSNVSTVIWMPQAPLLREYLHNHNCSGMPWYYQRINNKTDCAHEWKLSAWARAYNDAVNDILRSGSRSTYIWTAAKDISEHYTFDMVDTTHFMFECHLPGSRALPLRSQMLINFHCNQFMDEQQRTELCCDHTDMR